MAAIGLSAGGGMYVTSVSATAIRVITLTVLRRFERKDPRRPRRCHVQSTG